jgi:hypothetical protein
MLRVNSGSGSLLHSYMESDIVARFSVVALTRHL